MLAGREEKKKKAHVYSCVSDLLASDSTCLSPSLAFIETCCVFYRSGAGGGGTRGPPPVDKRTLDEPCPFCDRTFKQVSSQARHCLRMCDMGNCMGLVGRFMGSMLTETAAL